MLVTPSNILLRVTILDIKNIIMNPAINNIKNFSRYPTLEKIPLKLLNTIAKRIGPKIHIAKILGNFLGDINPTIIAIAKTINKSGFIRFENSIIFLLGLSLC